MKHLKFHPILESMEDAKTILKLIDETGSGKDLKAICDLDPKNSGRVYVKPIDLPGSKTYIEKDKLTEKYKFASLSNGVPFNTEIYDTPEEAFRMLWVYILSKNMPMGFNKKAFRSWGANPANSVHEKKLSSEEILSIFTKETGNPDMVKSYSEYFAEPRIKKAIEKYGITVNPMPKGFFVLYGPNQITSTINKIVGMEQIIESKSGVHILINPAKPMFKQGDTTYLTIGTKIGNIRDVEIKILEYLKNIMNENLKAIESPPNPLMVWRYNGSVITGEKNKTFLSLAMKIGINSISKILSGSEIFDTTDEFDVFTELSSSEMSIIRKESPDILWPEVLKRMDPDIANVSSDLGDLGF